MGNLHDNDNNFDNCRPQFSRLIRSHQRFETMTIAIAIDIGIEIGIAIAIAIDGYVPPEAATEADETLCLPPLCLWRYVCVCVCDRISACVCVCVYFISGHFDLIPLIHRWLNSCIRLDAIDELACFHRRYMQIN